ncbi:MAG: DUF839 domain-containing protein [Bryobacterales bacterium]|nr:DUF839 domain-containing protein [Bryobacterales bacterium]
MRRQSPIRNGDFGFEGQEPRRSCSETFDEILARRMGRREVLRRGAIAPVFCMGAIANLEGSSHASSLSFSPIRGSAADEISVTDGYTWALLAESGQPLAASAHAFDPDNLDPVAQRQQVGYNCDFLAWFDYVRGSGIVGVNHEYTNPDLMFSNYSADTATKRPVDYEITAHSVSFLFAIPSSGDQGPSYRHYPHSAFNRRIHGETPIAISGPVAGHALLRTATNQTGTQVRGTFNNCGGGITPWGTYLTAEENFDQYFANSYAVRNEMAEEANARFGAREWSASTEVAAPSSLRPGARAQRDQSIRVDC